MGLNAQSGLPVRTSNARTLPGGSSLFLGASVMAAPTRTTSLQTWGALEELKLVPRGPRPGRRSTRPRVPEERISVPVRGSIADKSSPRMARMSASEPVPQYAMPRLDAPPRSSPSNSWIQMVLPVEGSNASTNPIPFEAYNIPPTINGVERRLFEAKRLGL